MPHIPKYATEVLFEIRLRGYIPIVGHLERNDEVAEDQSEIIAICDKGVLLQVDLKSLTGAHGRKAKKTATRLIKNNMVSFIGNDAHTTKAQFLSPISVSDYCTKNLGKEETKKLLISYELAVINDIIIETEL